MSFLSKTGLEAFFGDLISGQNQSYTAKMLRGLLWGCELPYAVAMQIRNRLYDYGCLPVRGVDVPVIGVGNLTLGGAGKTPMVAYLTQWAHSQKLRPGLISRGYGKRESSGEQLNDEGMELAIRYPNVPHLQSADRFAAATQMLQKKKVDLLILDDAFQHRRMKRDLDIVLLDSRDPFGGGHIFPRGLLRESIRSLSRTHVVLLSRADLVSEARRQEIREQVEKIAPSAVWGEVVHKPSVLVSSYQATPRDDSQINTEQSGFFGQRTAPVDFLAGKRVFAFSGIAKPDTFHKILVDCRAEIAKFVAFSDHHAFTPGEIERLSREVKESGADLVICTMKDLVKIRKRTLGGKELWALAIGIDFLCGESDFLICLKDVER